VPNIKPIKVYYNCDTDKSTILKENRNKAAVYRWVNNINNKTYIGSTANLTKRLYKYYSAKFLMESKLPIIKALLKYGYSNFSLEVLEYCTQDKDTLIKREQYYLDLLKPEYNILTNAYSTLGYKVSEENLDKYWRGRIFSKETKELLSKAATGRILTEEERKKISEARKGIILSKETREKISKSTTALIGIPIKVKNIKTNEELVYTNLTEAGKALGVSRTAIKKALNRGKPIKKIFVVTND